MRIVRFTTKALLALRNIVDSVRRMVPVALVLLATFATSASAQPRLSFTIDASTIAQIHLFNLRGGYACLVRRPFQQTNLFGKLSPPHLELGARFKQLSKVSGNGKRAKRVRTAKRDCRVMASSPPTATPTPLPPEAIALVGDISSTVPAGSSLTVRAELRDRTGARAHSSRPLNTRLEVLDLAGTPVLDLRRQTLEAISEFTFLTPQHSGSYHLRISSQDPDLFLESALQVSPLALERILTSDTFVGTIALHVPFGVQVRAEDRFGNPISNSRLHVRISAGDASLEGVTSAMLRDGVAGFQGLTFTRGSEASLLIESEDGSVSSDPLPFIIKSGHSTALAWDPLPIELQSNITPWYRLREWNSTTNPLACQTAEFDAAIRVRAQEAKVHTDQMPEGLRTILFFWEMTPSWEDPRDLVRNAVGEVQGFTDAEGTFHPYLSPWWDNGARESHCRVTKFIDEFYRIGGMLDYAILDTERAMSNWHMDNLASDRYGADPKQFPLQLAEERRLAYYAAVNADPRMDQPDSFLFGFIDTRPLRAQLTLGDLVQHVALWIASSVRQGPHRNTYLQWNQLMQQRATRYKNFAVFEPIRARYPRIKMSEYESYLSRPEHSLHDSNGHQISLFSGPEQEIVGTMQAKPLYGVLRDWAYYYVRTPRLIYQGTPFNALRQNLNHVRSATLTRPDLPFQPWFAYRSFGSQPEIDGCPTCRLKDNDYYYELVYHTLLTSTAPPLFWNPAHLATASDNEVMSTLLVEYDRVARYSVRREPSVDSLIDWEVDYALSSEETDYGAIHRFTPMLEEAASIDSLIESVEPAIVRTPSGERLEFPRGRIERDPLSAKGLWIIEQRHS